jgi:segregation and condensation protein B
MPPSNLQPAIEALLFSSDQPLSLSLLAEAVDSAPDAVETALHALGESYASRGAGVELREIAGGWMLVTTAEQSEWVGRMLRGKRKMRLSRAGLETLAIIAYKQPVTKSEVEAIRGVDSSGVLATLLERNLVTIRGRSKVVGRPLLYGTTGEFLEHFGLKDLSELPRPEELRALVAAREPEQLDMMELEVVSQVATDLAAGEASGLFRTEHHVVEPLDAGHEADEDEPEDDDEYDDDFADDEVDADDEDDEDDDGDEAEDDEDDDEVEDDFEDDDDEDGDDEDEDEEDEVEDEDAAPVTADRDRRA